MLLRLAYLGVTNAFALLHPTTAWVIHAARNLVMDLPEAGSKARYLIRDRDGKYPALFDAILADAEITIVRSGVQVPPDERDHRAVGAHLPLGAARSDVDLQPAAFPARSA